MEFCYFRGMSKFQVLNYIKTQVPDFDADSEQHIRRAEKILTIALRETIDFQQGEVDETLDILNQLGAPFYQWATSDKNRLVFVNKGQNKFTKYKHYPTDFNLFNEDQLKLLSNYLSSEFSQLISTFANDFTVLKFVSDRFSPIFTVEIQHEFHTLVSNKTHAVYQASQSVQSEQLVQHYPFITDPNYFRVLSFVSFPNRDKIVVELVKDHPTLSVGKKNKIAKAKIVIAASDYMSENDQVKKYISAKQLQAQIDLMDERTLFSDKEKRLHKNWVLKDFTWSDGIILIFSYVLILVILWLAYHYIHPAAFWWIVLVSCLCSTVFYKAPNNWGLEEHDYENYTPFQRFKKINLDILIVLHYIGIVLGIATILIGILALLAYMMV